MLSAKAYRAIVSGQRRGPVDTAIRCGLSVLEWPYTCAMQLRNLRFDRGHASTNQVEVPVISVGNLTLGGTGKTPMVAWLAQWFRQHQIRVSIVSRGYGSGSGSRNDEAREMEARLPDVPQVQNADRTAAAQVAIEELYTQLIILDDGFQHRRLARDLDLVLIDATEPFGFGHVFPRGTLREPLAGLRRASAIALTRSNLVSQTEREVIRNRVCELAPQAVWMEVSFGPSHLFSAGGEQREVRALAEQPVAAFCGIGNPSAFQQTLSRAGLKLHAFREFPDHHDFSREDLESLIRWAEATPETRAVVCTHKDLVKIAVDRLGSKPLYALAIEPTLESGQQEFASMLHAVLQQIPKT